MRAYVPQLEAHGISQSDFLTCIDGLNESFVAHPIYQGLGIVGGVMGAFYGVQPVQWAGMGVQAASGVASAATSYLRTRAYVKAINTDLFHPAGLHMHVLTTKKMMEKVGHPEDKLNLPPLDTTGELYDRKLSKDEVEHVLSNTSPQNDPRLRRLQALEGYVMPLNTDVPNAIAPDSFFKKLSATQADRMSRKQNRRMIRKRSRIGKKSNKADRRQQRGDVRLERLTSRADEQDADFQKQMSMCKDEREQEKLLKRHEKEQEKLNRKVEKRLAKTERKVEKSSNKAERRRDSVDKKEHKTANKIRWLVISRWVEDDTSDDDSLPSSDDDGKS